MISVAMTTYFGESYVKEQVESILNNLSETDELVISDDGSTDSTIKILRSFNDPRIKLYLNYHLGINKNYEFVISKCIGDYIFLSDQDDVWLKGKVDRVVKTFKDNNCVIVEHDAYISINGEVQKKTFFQYRKVYPGRFRNWVRNTYHGSCMAFSKNLINNIIPIPETGCWHDQWIGMVSYDIGKTCYINEPLIIYRRHGKNCSVDRYPFYRQVARRIMTLVHYLEYKTRRHKCK